MLTVVIVAAVAAKLIIVRNRLAAQEVILDKMAVERVPSRVTGIFTM
jgi:hypothetical protein